ncbi:hypothetical protein AMTR_s00046p00220850 [Amborella trichopoda]|uniref:Oligopeptidase A N-terminal domain-containing protein n=1 Tax=Amborella trichopoda TaxID=13333 RepID=U5DCF8_AMBTC|nr:hypothetical protein AMTR_s00046p00220850 [Amborella trichopoda]
MAAKVAESPIPSSAETEGENPLLSEFTFPPYDMIEAKHVRTGIKTLLRRLEDDLVELENTVEPTWDKLVVPLEKIVDNLTVVWGIVNHLKSVKDNAELRSAIEEVHVRYQFLRLLSPVVLLLHDCLTCVKTGECPLCFI